MADQEREEQQGEIPLLAVEARMQASKAEVKETQTSYGHCKSEQK
jgi:hypothetical protein